MIGIMKRIKRNRIKIDRDEDPKVRLGFSPLLKSISENIHNGVYSFAHGDSLDVGAGHTPYREHIMKSVDVYHTLDREDSTARAGMILKPLNFTGDICKINTFKPLKYSKYDTIFSFEVLEHVESPANAVRNIHRLLKPGGFFIFTVPFMARIHDVPVDYHRFTRYAIEKWPGFKTIKLLELGGLWTFAGHQLSIILMGFCYGIPIIWPIVKFINPAIVRFYLFMDRFFGFKDVFPVGYFGVLMKEEQ